MINKINNAKASQHRVTTPHILNFQLFLLDNVGVENINPLKKSMKSLCEYGE